jgi:hypothetical protein
MTRHYPGVPPPFDQHPATAHAHHEGWQAGFAHALQTLEGHTGIQGGGAQSGTSTNAARNAPSGREVRIGKQSYGHDGSLRPWHEHEMQPPAREGHFGQMGGQHGVHNAPMGAHNAKMDHFHLHAGREAERPFGPGYIEQPARTYPPAASSHKQRPGHGAPFRGQHPSGIMPQR